MDWKLIVRGLIAWLCVVAMSAGGARAEESFVLPTERCGDYFFVEMAVSGDPDRTLAMVLDSGAGKSVIDPDAVERETGKRLNVGQWARFSTLTVGGVTFSDIRAQVVELDHLERAMGRPLDGILGQPVFEDVLLTYDYAASEVRISFGDLPAPNGRDIVRLVGELTRPFVQLRFGRSSRRVLIDTGSGSGFVLGKPDRMDWQVAPRGVTGAIRINRIEVREAGRCAHNVLLGPTVVQTPTIEITDGTELVGTQVLKHFTLTFDMTNRRMRLEQTSEGPIESAPIRGIGVALRPRPEGVMVAHVFEGLPAATAGVQVGDVITHSDGSSVYGEARCKASDDGDAGVRRLTILRDGEILHIDVPVQELVP